MKSAISLILVLFMMSTSIGLVYASTGDNTSTSGDNDNIILPIDPSDLFSGYLSINLNPATLHVNDTVQIIITATNSGLVDWGYLTIYAPVPTGLQFLSFEAPGLTMQNYNPTTGIWDVYQMRDFNRGQQKTGIITAKVLPSAAGKTIIATAKFNSLVLEGYNINMVSSYPASLPYSRPITTNVAADSQGGPSGGEGSTPGVGNGGNGDNDSSTNGKGKDAGNGADPAINFGDSILSKYVGNLTKSDSNNNPLASLQTIGGGSGSDKKAYEINKIPTATNSDSVGNIFVIFLVIGMIATGIFFELRKNR